MPTHLGNDNVGMVTPDNSPESTDVVVVYQYIVVVQDEDVFAIDEMLIKSEGFIGGFHTHTNVVYNKDVLPILIELSVDGFLIAFKELRSLEATGDYGEEGCGSRSGIHLQPPLLA